MKFNISKWLPLIMTGMEVAQKVSGAKGGQAKLDAVMESLPDALEAVESGAGDVLNEPAVYEAIQNAISAIKHAENTIRAAKQIKNKPVAE